MLQMDLLRHGESELSGTLRGSLDDALTTLGWVQMQDSIAAELHRLYAVQMLEPTEPLQCPWQAIWSSPLQRCADFARDLAQRFAIPLFLLPALQEMNFGAWEGISTQSLYEQYPEQLAQFWQHPTKFSPPNAESMQVFLQRVQQGLLDIAQQMQEQQIQHVLLITHAGVIKLLKCLVAQTDLDLILTQSAELGQLHHFVVDMVDTKLIIQQHTTESADNLENTHNWVRP